MNTDTVVGYRRPATGGRPVPRPGRRPPPGASATGRIRSFLLPKLGGDPNR